MSRRCTIPWCCTRTTATPLGQIDLPVCFETPSNFRWETLTFEVVGFRGTYHTILGRPCHAKFMVVPNYTYLTLKMPGPSGVITVGSAYKHAYECNVACTECRGPLRVSSTGCQFRETL
jgi:hypothetical protein